MKKNNFFNSFSDLISPVTDNEFVQEYWEKKVLYLNRNKAKFYQPIFSIEIFDQLLEFNRPTGTSLRIVKEQQPLNSAIYENKDGSLNINQIYTAYADGHTIVINEVQRFWEPLRIFVEGIRKELSHHAVANVYLTPSNEKALLPHYDTHDVFVLQISGEKEWILYDDEDFKTPLVHSFQPVFNRTHLKETERVVMKAGDLMYVPRGVPHEAFTKDQSSMHITIGIHSTQVVDFLIKSLKTLSLNNLELRKSMPIGYLNREVEELNSIKIINLINDNLEILRSKSVLGYTFNLLEEDFRNESTSGKTGHFISLNQLENLKLSTQVKIRNNFIVKTTNDVSGARILFPGNVIKGPATIAEVFDFVASKTESFKIDDLPLVSNENKIKIIHRLIRGGLLEIVN